MQVTVNRQCPPTTWEPTGSPRPHWLKSDTFLVHVEGLCRYDEGQCDYFAVHSFIKMNYDYKTGKAKSY